MSSPKEFRAWNKGTKTMVDLRAITPLALAIIPDAAEAGCGVYIPDHPNLEIMQWTGRRDSKRTTDYPDGQKIWESDIVEDNVGRRWVVEYNKRNMAFLFAYVKHRSQKQLYRKFNQAQRPLKRIGNIHQQPDLLKVKE